MTYYLGLAGVLLAGLVPEDAPKARQDAPKARPPESLLAADSVVYFRYDGYESHQKAYERTALGRAMKDDLGEFLEYLVLVVAENITTNLPEKNPGEMQRLAGGWKKLLEYWWRHGLVAGLEVNRTAAGANTLPLFDVPARVRLTVVFPEGGAGKNREALLPLLSVLTGQLAKQVGGRTIHEWADNDFRIAWWQEGRHVVLVLGNDSLEGFTAVAAGRRPDLQSSPLFQNVAGFKDYETDIRGFVNVKPIVDLLRGPGSSVDALDQVKEWLTRTMVLNQLGLTSVKNLTFHMGFDRQYQRSTMIVNVAEPGQRAGLARLLSAAAPLNMDRLPPLPPDAASVRIGHLDWKAVQDLGGLTKWLLGLQGLLDNGQLPPAGGAGPDLGVDISKEILAQLDSTLVLYNSLSEGPFFLGQGVAIMVKDEKKLDEGLQKLQRGLAGQLLGETQKRTYRGVDMFVFAPSIPYLPVAPTYAIHNGWLLIGVLPQTVKGCILRAEGRHKAWQVPPLVAEAIALAGKKAGPKSKLAAVTVTDPRPTVTVGLSLLPLVARLVESSGVAFDVAKVPNAQTVTEWQFPGVTLLHDDGHALRWESHSAFEIPGGEWLLFGLSYVFQGL